MRWKIGFWVAFGVVAAGCGGSGGSGGPGTPAPSATTLGPMTLEGFVSGEPVFAAGDSASMVGVTGTFSAVTLTNPKPTLDQTQIAFAEQRRLFAIDYDGRNERPLIGTRASEITRISYSPGGGTIYFSDAAGLWSVPSSGGTPASIKSGVINASVSPDGTRMLYEVAGVGIYTEPIGGGTATLIPGSAAWPSPSWYDNAFIIIDFGSITHIRRVSDGAQRFTFNTGLGGGRFGRYMFSTFIDVVRKISRHTINAGVNSNSSATFDMPADEIELIAVSPDTKEIVTLEQPDGTASDPSILRRRNPNTMGLISTMRQGTIHQTTYTAVAWQPFVTNRVVAGVGSLFGGDAHAVVLGRSNTKPGGIALARALTPSTVRMSADDRNGNGPNVTYVLEADRFLKLSFSLDKNFSLFNAPVTATTNGAFITFTSNTGDVVDIITYSVSRGSGKPTFRKEGSLRVYEGSIQGVFDAKGKNLVPQGASQVKLDLNGKLVAQR